jgi:hypothetical protein
MKVGPPLRVSTEAHRRIRAIEVATVQIGNTSDLKSLEILWPQLSAARQAIYSMIEHYETSLGIPRDSQHRF